METFASLLSSGLAGPFAAAKFVWLLQLALVVHVVRTGRPYWWIWILLSAPFIGGLAYVLVELAPSLKSPGGHAFQWKPRKWRIRELRTVLEDSDTVRNRLALARELADDGRMQEAHEIAADCLQGVFRDDPHTLTEVARYKLGLDRFQEALALLDRVNTHADRRLAFHVGFLRGESLYGLGRYEEAESCYRGVDGKLFGEAPRAGLARVMEKTGRRDQAAALWRDIRSKYRKASPAWRRSEKKWYRLATEKLKASKG
jgi:hypothetical protein